MHWPQGDILWERGDPLKFSSRAVCLGNNLLTNGNNEEVPHCDFFSSCGLVLDSAAPWNRSTNQWEEWMWWWPEQVKSYMPNLSRRRQACILCITCQPQCKSEMFSSLSAFYETSEICPLAHLRNSAPLYLISLALSLSPCHTCVTEWAPWGDLNV